MSDQEIRQAMNRPLDFKGDFWVDANLIPRERSLNPPEPIVQKVIEPSDVPEPITKDKPPNNIAKKLSSNIVDRLIRRAEKER